MAKLITIAIMAGAAGAALCVGACGHSSADQGKLGTVSQDEDGLLKDYGGSPNPAERREVVRVGDSPTEGSVTIERGGASSQERVSAGPAPIRPTAAAARPSDDPYAEPPVPQVVIERGTPPPPEPEPMDEPPAAAAPAGARDGFGFLNVAVFGADECWVKIAGRDQGKAPLLELEVAAGDLTLDVTCGDGQRTSRQVDVEVGEHREVVIELDAVGEEPRAKPKAKPKSKSKSKKRKRRGRR